jgi:hypothetical protein
MTTGNNGNDDAKIQSNGRFHLKHLQRTRDPLQSLIIYHQRKHSNTKKKATIGRKLQNNAITIKTTTTMTTGWQNENQSILVKSNSRSTKKLPNHSVIQATTYRHNNKSLKWWDSFKKRPPWSICLFYFFYLVELKL